jgi:hypothetical protein
MCRCSRRYVRDLQGRRQTSSASSRLSRCGFHPGVCDTVTSVPASTNFPCTFGATVISAYPEKVCIAAIEGLYACSNFRDDNNTGPAFCCAASAAWTEFCTGAESLVLANTWEGTRAYYNATLEACESVGSNSGSHMGPLDCEHDRVIPHVYKCACVSLCLYLTRFTLCFAHPQAWKQLRHHT